MSGGLTIAAGGPTGPGWCEGITSARARTVALPGVPAIARACPACNAKPIAHAAALAGAPTIAAGGLCALAGARRLRRERQRSGPRPRALEIALAPRVEPSRQALAGASTSPAGGPEGSAETRGASFSRSRVRRPPIGSRAGCAARRGGPRGGGEGEGGRWRGRGRGEEGAKH